MKVKVYFNLHKHLFSVQEKVNGRWKVVRHTDDITLHNVTFKVSEAGRQRVLREKRKNVHAYVIGHLSDYQGAFSTEVKYNPYKYDSFVDSLEDRVYTSEVARLHLVDGKAKILAKANK